MSPLPGGVSADDFVNFLLSDWGRTVTRTPRTQGKDNVTGRETWTNGTPVSITALIVRPAKSWMFDEEGQIEGGDAYIMVGSTVTIAEGDLITVDSDKFYLKDLLVTPDATNTLAKYGNLFLWET